jgi:hypothetical protein
LISGGRSYSRFSRQRSSVGRLIGRTLTPIIEGASHSRADTKLFGCRRNFSRQLRLGT